MPQHMGYISKKVSWGCAWKKHPLLADGRFCFWERKGCRALARGRAFAAGKSHQTPRGAADESVGGVPERQGFGFEAERAAFAGGDGAARGMDFSR